MPLSMHTNRNANVNKIMTLAVLSLLATPSAPASGSIQTGVGRVGQGQVHGKLDGRVASAGSGCVMIFDKDGKVLWQREAGIVHDVWVLPGGNVLYADGQVVEVDPKTNEVVFQYEAKFDEGGGIYSCQRLGDGKTLIAENSTGRILEVDKQGKVLFQLQLEGIEKGAHHNLRMARKLDNGNYLVCHSGKHLVREYTSKGEVVLELKAENIAYSAVRLASGNTVVGHLDNVTEFDAKGKKVWEFNNKKDGKDVEITNMCGVHVLGNGNLVIGVYSADTGEKGAVVFEITRKKEVVWRYCNPEQSNMMSAQKLDADGKVLSKVIVH